MTRHESHPTSDNSSLNPLRMNNIPGQRRPSDDAGLLEDWATTMRADNLSERTIRERRFTVLKVSRRLDVGLTEMTTADVRRFIASYANPSSRVTQAGALRAWHVYLLAEGIRPDDPAAVVRPRAPRGVPRPATTEQVSALLAAADGSSRAIVALAAYAGLRVHEIARVHGRDICDGSLRVLGKGGRTDLIPCHPVVLDEASRMPANRLWFPSPVRERTAVSRHWVMDRFAEVATAAGVDITAHQLRHWYATELVRAGVDLRTVQTLMRHAELSSTAIYTAVFDESRVAAVLRLPNL